MHDSTHAALSRLSPVRAAGRSYAADRVYVVGVLNVTPDSFSDGGRYLEPDGAVRRAEEMAREGADIIDIGGESTRPSGRVYGFGAAAVDAAEERRRVVPVVRQVCSKLGLAVSVDTSKADVAGACLAEGAQWINDVTALSDPAMAPLLARSDCGVVLMHMRGTPQTTAAHADFADVVSDVSAELAASLRRATDAGIDPDRVVLDPGLGFGKGVRHNLELLRRLSELLVQGRPLLVGPSRKRFVGAALGGAEISDRIWGTAAAVATSIAAGATFVRVHDVEEMAQVARVAEAIRRGELRSDSEPRFSLAASGGRA